MEILSTITPIVIDYVPIEITYMDLEGCSLMAPIVIQPLAPLPFEDNKRVPWTYEAMTIGPKEGKGALKITPIEEVLRCPRGL